MIEFVALNWGELLVGLMAFAKVIVNLTPTQEDNAVFGRIDGFINFFVKDRLK
jgi:hypothetical protein